MDVYSTASTIPMVASLRKRASFMLDRFFGQYLGPTGQREIVFDVEADVLAVAPFVSPLVEGKAVAEAGYQSNTFTPAYVKPFMPLDPFGPIYRSQAEPLLGTLTPGQREKARVAKGFADLIGMCYRRLEMMAIEAVKTGTNVIVGDGYPSKTVTYGRAAGQTVQLTSGDRWGETDVSPVDDLDDWIMTVATAIGIQPDVIVMDALAWKLYEADPKLEKRRDTVLAGYNASVDLGLSDGVEGGVLKATLAGGKVKIYVYNQIYKHPTTGVATNMMPDYGVFIGCSDSRCQGVRAFGTIIDPELGYESSQLVDPQSGAIMDFAPKSWTVPNPAARFLMVQTAPLTALIRPNATMFVAVR